MTDTINLEPADDQHEYGIHVYDYKEVEGVAGFRFRFDRLYDEKDAIWCELSIERLYFGVEDEPRHIFGPERINLLAGTWRRTIRNELAAQTDEYDWETVLGNAITATVQEHRTTGLDTSYAEAEPVEGEEHPFLLEPFIANSGVTVLYGEGGVGKSTMAIAMALAVASGQPLWGTFPARSGNVLYVDYEDESMIHFERLDALLAGFEITKDQMEYDIFHVPLVSKLAHAQHDLRRVVMEKEAVLVVLDSIGMARGGDAMGADDTIRMFRALRSIGAPVLALDHVTKQDKRSRTVMTPYGSVYTINTARLLWGALIIEEESTAAERQINMVNTKANRVAIQPRCGFSITYRNDEKQLVREINMTMNDGEWAPAKRTASDEIIDFLDEQPGRYYTLREIEMATGIDRRAAEKVFERNATKFDRTKLGNAYAYRQVGFVDEEEEGEST